MKLKALIAACAVVMSTGALAADYNLTFSGGLANSGAGVLGSFTDFWDFSVASNGTLTSSVTTLNGFPSIANGAWSLYDASNNKVGGSWLFGTTNAVSLTAGSYYFAISGLTEPVRTPALSAYSVAASFAPAAPVPEPETYAMMLAGLGAVGFMARRRKVK